ncbi:hypothetical protein JVU11DRAFT_9197 [Chiua virens]|nr:hypothetical protein JVU11DRAFT_9197 [Chiua virens]
MKEFFSDQERWACWLLVVSIIVLNVCGGEFCAICSQGGEHTHIATACCLIPISRFKVNEPQHTAVRMQRALRSQCSTGDVHMHSADLPPRRDVVTLQEGASIDTFRRHWSTGDPVVVSGLNVVFEDLWTPSAFQRDHGSTPVELVNCETNEKTESTVWDFFSSFGKKASRPRSGAIHKLKDWPPTEHFRDVFPKLYEAFLEGLPFRDLTRPDGVLNFAAYFPENSLAPDLGPKMYVAHASLQDDEHHGSTRLHFDVADAINVMTWAESQPDGSPGSALWHIFPACTAPVVRRFLTTIPHAANIDSIQSQHYYLTPRMLRTLAEQYNVHPFVIYQKPGDAVFIPAGCPHQVSNCDDAIKIACDFVSPENLHATVKLVQDFRSHRLYNKSGDDLLQLPLMLWYAWLTTSLQGEKLGLEKHTSVGSMSDSRTGVDRASLAKLHGCPSPGTSLPHCHEAAQDLWKRSTSAVMSTPAFFYCGGYDASQKAVPVMKGKGIHLWIPACCRFGIRLLNHMLYCLWFTSMDGRIPDAWRGHIRQVGNYVANIREAFFEEVRSWYDSDVQPEGGIVSFSDRTELMPFWLKFFLLLTYERNTPIPYQQNSGNVATCRWWERDVETLDWSEWRKRSKLNELIFGSTPGQGTEEFEDVGRFYADAGLPLVPDSSTEVDSNSWGMYSSEVTKALRR